MIFFTSTEYATLIDYLTTPGGPLEAIGGQRIRTISPTQINFTTVTTPTALQNQEKDPKPAVVFCIHTTIISISDSSF